MIIYQIWKFYSRESVISHITEAPCLADVLSAVHKEVLHHHPERPHVVPGQVVLALLLVPGEAGAVVLGQEGLGGGNGNFTILGDF